MTTNKEQTVMNTIHTIKRKWQEHNRQHGMSWNEVAELVNEVEQLFSECYRKVKCEDRLPEENGRYLTDIGELNWFSGGAALGWYRYKDESYVTPQWWLEPISDQPKDTKPEPMSWKDLTDQEDYINEHESMNAEDFYKNIDLQAESLLVRSSIDNQILGINWIGLFEFAEQYAEYKQKQN